MALMGISSIFLFSIVMLLMVERMWSYYRMILFGAAWSLICLVCARTAGGLRDFLFGTVPLAVHVAITVGCFLGDVIYGWKGGEGKMLSLVNIRKDYGKFTAIEDLNLELEEGLYAMLAPNGAGKTTIIRMMTTLLFPTSGEILYDGKIFWRWGRVIGRWWGICPSSSAITRAIRLCNICPIWPR